METRLTDVRDALEEDMPWVKRIFQSADHVLGKGFFGSIWWRYWQSKNPRERWIVIEGRAFAHYVTRRDGVKVLYEIAVAEESRRMGLGKLLLDYIGRPMELKTDADHGESNAFYRALGFHPVGSKRSRDGKKVMRIYRCAP